MNLKYLCEAGFINFSNEDVTTSYSFTTKVEGGNFHNLKAFIGEANLKGKPKGFIQLIDENGHIYQGNFTPECKRHGFCVTYSGKNMEIEIGWYRNDKIFGNYVKLDA